MMRHLRRFGPFYAIAAIFAIGLIVLPSRPDRDRAGSLTGSTSQTSSPSSKPDGGVAKGAPGGASTAAASCKQGAPQIAGSAYAAPCQESYDGPGAGATYRGVTSDRILIARRTFPDTASSRAAAAFAANAGTAAPEVTAEVRRVFEDYFNKTYELYGRKVVFTDLPASPGVDASAELQGRGKEGACVDATRAQEELKVFGVETGSGPFSECAATRGVVVFAGGPYYPESWYQKYNPYVWNQVTECERIAYQVAEYVGKRLAGKRAVWAGDALLQQQTRRFATYVPNNDEYQHCVDISEKTLKGEYGVNIASRYNYTLDISRFPDETARGVLQFKAAGVTTVINADDPISMSFLTQAATGQVWHPEWFVIGVAAQDTDGVARLFDAKQVDGHLFGMSQLGRMSDLWGPGSEPGIVYKRVTGKEIPDGTTGDYFQLMQIFNFLQAAGPILTPESMSDGIHKLPPAGAPSYAIGYVSFADGPDGTRGAGDHTGIDDSREIYWCGTCVSSFDGKRGTYLESYGGKRFRNGEWPVEQPPVYPS